MSILPINVSHVTRATLEMLRDDPQIGVAGTMVERSEELNKTPTAHGWIGIYREDVDYVAKTLGMGTGYRDQHIRLVLLVQESDSSSGEQCEDRLEELLQKVAGRLLSDTSLKGTVQNIGEFSVRYESYEKQKSGVYMQNARIHLTGIAPVSVT